MVPVLGPPRSGGAAHRGRQARVRLPVADPHPLPDVTAAVARATARRSATALDGRQLRRAAVVHLAGARLRRVRARGAHDRGALGLEAHVFPPDPRRRLDPSVVYLVRPTGSSRRRLRRSPAGGPPAVPGAARGHESAYRRTVTVRPRRQTDAALRRRRFAGATTQLGTEVSINFGVVARRPRHPDRRFVRRRRGAPDRDGRRGAALYRPKRAELTWRRLWPALALGVVLAVMNLAFYESVHLLGLGIAATIEFLGPLALALATSRRLLDVGARSPRAPGSCSSSARGRRMPRRSTRGASRSPSPRPRLGGLHRAHPRSPSACRVSRGSRSRAS